MTLAGAPSLKVRPFDSQLALVTYLRVSRLDLIVCDFDSESARADRLAEDLRSDARLECHDFQIIALASALTGDAKQASIHAGIDEIIMKPMSPRYLLERVLSRLNRRVLQFGAQASRHAPERRSGLPRPGSPPDAWARFGDNVVPLFGRGPQPQH